MFNIDESLINNQLLEANYGATTYYELLKGDWMFVVKFI